MREIARKRGVRKKGRKFRRREIKLGRKSMAEREEGYLEKKKDRFRKQEIWKKAHVNREVNRKFARKGGGKSGRKGGS